MLADLHTSTVAVQSQGRGVPVALSDLGVQGFQLLLLCGNGTPRGVLLQLQIFHLEGHSLCEGLWRADQVQDFMKWIAHVPQDLTWCTSCKSISSEARLNALALQAV